MDLFQAMVRKQTKKQISEEVNMNQTNCYMVMYLKTRNSTSMIAIKGYESEVLRDESPSNNIKDRNK